MAFSHLFLFPREVKGTPGPILLFFPVFLDQGARRHSPRAKGPGGIRRGPRGPAAFAGDLGAGPHGPPAAIAGDQGARRLSPGTWGPGLMGPWRLSPGTLGAGPHGGPGVVTFFSVGAF